MVHVERSVFGTLPDGGRVAAVTLTIAAGVTATVIAWGATLQSLIMPDREGHRADVVLGHETLAEYLDQPQYFGATVGRWIRPPTTTAAVQAPPDTMDSLFVGEYV